MRSVEIPAGSPFFAGHFPGHPILPGIAHPFLVTRAPVAEIPVLKLRSPVLPGDVLAVVESVSTDGAVRFELRRSAEIVSQGTLRLASPEPGRMPALVVPSLEAPGGFPPVAALLPHQPPARLLREVLEASAEELIGLAEIPAASPFIEAGRAPAFLGLEAAAQGAAALEALSRRDDSGPRIGYLVGLRNAHFQSPWLPAEQPFRIAVRLSGNAASLSIYEVTVQDGAGTELARGTLSTFITSATPSQSRTTGEADG
jgi:3-hydroxymyristoyl/3-hydroxydecanoyl-(acyl carrier protein) dehydratase